MSPPTTAMFRALLDNQGLTLDDDRLANDALDGVAAPSTVGQRPVMTTRRRPSVPILDRPSSPGASPLPCS